jgi:chromosome segregation ATPase
LADTLFTFDMKKKFILSMLISSAMVCSCQKQDSTAEQQLAQRKTELETREKALDERVDALDAKVNALDERVNVLVENEMAAANARMITPAQSSDTISDPTQSKAARDRKIQEIAAEFRAMVPDSGKDRITKERLSQAQGALKELMSQKQPKWQTSGAAGSPAAEIASPTPSPAIDTTPQ